MSEINLGNSELRLAAFRTWVEEELKKANTSFLTAPEESAAEEYWKGSSYTLSCVVYKLNELLGEE